MTCPTKRKIIVPAYIAYKNAHIEAMASCMAKEIILLFWMGFLFYFLRKKGFKQNSADVWDQSCWMND